MRGMFKMPIGIGISSLMMMFIGLTMASIMGLSLMTSYRDFKLTQKEIESTKAYYEAEAKANQMLLDIEETYDVYQTATANREDLLEKALEKIEGVTADQYEEGLEVVYSVPVVEGQNLRVELKIPIKKSDTEVKIAGNKVVEETIKIMSWQVVQEKPWQYEGENFEDTMFS